eukprot:1392853-Amorphochlora_amoeboformis.AAC.1
MEWIEFEAHFRIHCWRLAVVIFVCPGDVPVTHFQPQLSRGCPILVMDAEANPPRQVLESKKGGQKPKMEPLLDGKDQNRYGEIWKAQFRSKSWTGSKEYAVELTTATFRIQGCEYEIEGPMITSCIEYAYYIF